MEKIESLLKEYDKKEGRPSYREAILRMFQQNPDAEYDYNEMLQLIDEKYAMRPKNPAHVNKELMKLTREGVLIRRKAKKEGSEREIYKYRVREPGE